MLRERPPDKRKVGGSIPSLAIKERLREHMNEIRAWRNDRVRIKEGWEGDGRSGLVIGDSYISTSTNIRWTPVVWDDDAEDEPEFVKSKSLEME